MYKIYFNLEQMFNFHIYEYWDYYFTLNHVKL